MPMARDVGRQPPLDPSVGTNTSSLNLVLTALGNGQGGGVQVLPGVGECSKFRSAFFS